MSHRNPFALSSDEYVFGPHGEYARDSMMDAYGRGAYDDSLEDMLVVPDAVYSAAARNDVDDMMPEEAAFRGVRKRIRDENVCEDGPTKTLSLHDEKMRIVALIRGIVSSKFVIFGVLDEAILLEFMCVVVSCDELWSYARADARVDFKRKTGYYDVLENIVQELQNVSSCWDEQEDVWNMGLDFPDFLVPLHRLIDVALTHCTLQYNTLVYRSFSPGFSMALGHNTRHQHVTNSTMLLYFVLLSSEDTLDELKHFLMRLPFEYRELEEDPRQQPLETLDVALRTGMRRISKDTDFGRLMYDAMRAKAAVDTPRECMQRMSGMLLALMQSNFFHR